MVNLLDKLGSWVKSQGPKQQDRSTPWAWIMGIVVSLISIATVAFLYYKAWKNGKELARLQSEHDVNQEKEIEAKSARLLNTNSEKVIEYNKSYVRSQKAVLRSEKRVKDAEDEKNSVYKEIDAVQNWSDVDGYLNGHNKK